MMVILRQLITQDFKHLDVDITFPQGILAISGPNESGKSSIFEAILFAFFGRTHKAPMGQKDRLINYDAEKTFVRLIFELDGTKYRITRQIHSGKRPSQAQLHKIDSSGQASLLATGVTNVDKEINTLLNGISLADLLASNIVLQKDLDRLAQMPKMERRHVINAMMGRECFSRADDKLALELRPIRKTLEPEQKALEQLRHRKEDFEKQTEEQEAKQQALTRLEQQLKLISQTLAQTEKNYAAVRAYKDVHDKQNELQRELTFRKQTETRLTKQLASASKLQSQQKRLKKQQQQLDYLKDDMAKFQKIEETSDQLGIKIDEQQMVTELISRLEGQIDGFEPLEQVLVEYEQVKVQRQKAEASRRRIFSPLLYVPSIGLLAAGIGSIFFNPLIGGILIVAALPFLGYLAWTFLSYSGTAPDLNQLRRREESLSEQVVKYRVMEDYQMQLKDRIQNREKISKEIDVIAKRMFAQLTQFSPSVLEDIEVPNESEVDALQQVVRRVEQKLFELKAGVNSISEQLTSIEGQLKGMAEAEEDLEQTKVEIVTFTDELSSLSFPTLPKELGDYSDGLYEELDHQVRKMGEEKVRLQTERKKTVERMDELKSLLQENKGVVDEYVLKEREVAKLEEDIKTGEFIIEFLREVAERGREQVRPRVVNVMERLLATITDGKYRFPKLSEDYSLKVYSSEAGEYVGANLYSGGTEDQFLLALRLGFAIALLPQGRGTAPQFLLLDEPFGGSDIERRDNIIRLLQDELSRTFQQIIVVSHQTAVLSASEHQYRMANGRVIRSE
ncbi:MAG: AAA family ATPase [Promethearchaeota archaeon]